MAHFAGQKEGDIVRRGTVLQLHDLAAQLLLAYSLPGDTDVGTLSLALTTCAARTLAVPHRCIFLTWPPPPLVRASPGTVVNITCTLVDLDESFVGADGECFACGDTCEDADDPRVARTREQNCVRCVPCYLCLACSFSVISCCPFCLEPGELELLTPTQRRRACLVTSIHEYSWR